MIELLATIQIDGDALALIDGQETRLSQQTIGREVTPLVENLVVRVDEEIVIPMMGMSQSLNVSVATAVVLYDNWAAGAFPKWLAAPARTGGSVLGQ